MNLNTPVPPSHTLFYWKPWREDSNFIKSWFDYCKDISLIDYTADSIGKYVLEASEQQIKSIGKLGKEVGLAISEATEQQINAYNKGVEVLSKKLDNINKELEYLNFQQGIQVEQQRMTNLLLENIAELLRVPNSEKERQHNIELGIKFFISAKQDEDLFDDALEEFLKAEQLMKQDYFVLHRIGLIYLYSQNHINVEKAFEYFSKAAKYAVVDNDPRAILLVNVLHKKISESIVQLESKNDIGLLAADSYEKAALTAYILGKNEFAIKNQLKALKYSYSLTNKFKLAKYYARNNDIIECVKLLDELINEEPDFAVLIFKDFDLINLPEVLTLVEEKNKYLNNDILSELEKWDNLNSTVKLQSIEWLNQMLALPFNLKSKKNQDILKLKHDYIEKINSLVDKYNQGQFIDNSIDLEEVIIRLKNYDKFPTDYLISLYENDSQIFESKELRVGVKFNSGIVCIINKNSNEGLILAENDLGLSNWLEANKKCEILGDGWRLPTIDELDIILQKKELLSLRESENYWSATEIDDNLAWRIYSGSSKRYDVAKSNSCYILPVKECKF